MTYEGFVYVIYQDDGNWSIDQISATVYISVVRDWIEMTFQDEEIGDDNIDLWMKEIINLNIGGEFTATDGQNYLHIRKVNPERIGD